MEIVGYIKLINGLRVTSECLEKSFNIKVNGVQGSLLIPSIPTNLSMVLPGIMPKLIQPKSHIQFNEDLFEWGRLYSRPSGESIVNRFMIEFEYRTISEFDQIGSKIREGIGSWIIRFRENLFAFEYNIDAPGFKVINSIQDDYKLYYRLNVEESSIKDLDKDPEEVFLLIEEPITLKDLAQTIKITSENKHLILEYQLLKDANQALLNDNYRKSILDCASALELCLTNALKRGLPIKGTFLVEILKMNNTIRKKRDLMKFTQQKLPDYDYQQSIEDLRNRAIHIGKTPTEIEAKKAYKIVKEVVGKLTIEKFE